MLLLVCAASMNVAWAQNQEVLKPTVDTYMRMGNTANHGSETTIELCTYAEGSKDFVGYLSFILNKPEGYKVKSATLRVTTERIKGDRTLNLYAFDANVEGNAKYRDYAEAIAAAKKTNIVGTVELEGQNGKSCAADKIDAEKYQTITAWQNTIDVTAYVQTLTTTKFGLLLARDDANNSNKIFTSEATGIENAKCNFFNSCTAADLQPQLTVEYEEDKDVSSNVLTPLVDTYLRLNNTANHGGETTMELCTSAENSKDFVGYMSFEYSVPAGMELESAVLRVTTERIKGDRTLNFYAFDAAVAGNAKYEDYADAIAAAKATDIVGTVELEGQNNKSCTADEITDEKYQTITAWQNTIDLTAFVKTQTGNFGLLLACDEAYNSNKIFTSEATGIENAKCDFFNSCTADDLVPQLTLVFHKVQEEVKYNHPALLHTATNIARVKAAIEEEGIIKSAYEHLKNVGAGANYTASPVEYLKRMNQNNWSETYSDYNNYTQAAKDAKAAYQLALRYRLGDEEDCATAAVNILNAWADTNKGFLRLDDYSNNIPDPNEYLMTIQAYQFANAAELLRDYSGWQTDEFTKFQNWMRSTYVDVSKLFLENHHNNDNPLHYWLNWDLAALNAILSVGILCDDKTLVDYVINYSANGTGTGNVNNAIVATHEDADSDETLAQCQESGRDQGHATLDVTLLGVLCKTAENIGIDLYTPYKALEMAEYVAKYNLKNDAAYNYAYAYSDMPFSEYYNGEVTHTAISSDARGTVRPCWELFYAYAQKNGKQARYCQQWSEWERRKNDWGEATGESTDELGFGTLMFMSSDAADYSYTLIVSDAGAATMVLPFDATIPSGVEVYTLNYTSGDYATTTAIEGTIPANTPVLVKATAGNYTFQGSSIWTKGTATKGALTGVFMKTIVPTASYILTYKEGVLAFRKVDGTTNFVEANRAYLTAESSNAKIDIQFEGSTGINEIEQMGNVENEKLFNLSGQQIKSAKKGVYIKNGRKFIIK